MKYLLIILLLNSLLFSGYNSKRIDKHILVRCIEGYKFVIVYSYYIEGGIGISQIFAKSNLSNQSPQPIECKETK